jgi:hypothetical protein
MTGDAVFLVLMVLEAGFIGGYCYGIWWERRREQNRRLHRTWTAIMTSIKTRRDVRLRGKPREFILLDDLRRQRN